MQSNRAVFIFLVALISASIISGCGDTRTTNEPDRRPSTSQLALAEPLLARIVDKARFTVLGDRLYTAAGGGIIALDISSPKAPLVTATTPVSSTIETISTDGKLLLVGTAGVVRTYEVSSPDHPTLAASLDQIRSCDAMVAKDSKIYAALRKSAGGTCPAESNRIVIRGLSSDQVTSDMGSVPMLSPRALSLSGSSLFVCDGTNGLIHLNVSDLNSISQVAAASDDLCDDVYTMNDRLFVRSSDGLSQYDLKTAAPLTRLSRITFSK